MRELTVRLRFTSPSLGNVKKYVRDPSSKIAWPVFFMPRSLDSRVRFESKWWKSGLVFAAEILCRHQRDVKDVEFDVLLDGRPDTNVRNFYKRFFKDKSSKQRFVRHEAFLPGDMVGVNCVVPDSITNESYEQLMQLFGRFRGISPFRPKQYGHFEVETIRQKRL